MSKKIADSQFMHRLNRKPSKNEIEQKMGKTYIPISILEAKLDSFFNGAWSTKNISTTIVGNELVVSLELHFYHPKLDTWLCRVGVGASMVRQKRDSAISDIDAKIKNALEMDAPNAKSKAFKNAVKSIGKAFGRDLMREMGITITDPTITYADNTAANLLAEEDIVTMGNQFIRTPYHYTKECVADKIVQVKHIPTADNLADIFTKSVSRQVLERLLPYVTGNF